MSNVRAEFDRTGRVPKGYAATCETEITIQRERLVTILITVTDKIVREGRSVKREKLPTSSWSLFPINAVPCINLKSTGEMTVTLHDFSKTDKINLNSDRVSRKVF